MFDSWADQAPWSSGWSQQCARRCVPAGRLEECLDCPLFGCGRGIMESMALYNLVARLILVSLGSNNSMYASCHILLICFCWRPNTFLQFSNQIGYPFSPFVWSPHISTYTKQSLPFSPTTTHQVVIERLPPDLFDPPPRVDSQVLKLEPHQADAFNPSTWDDDYHEIIYKLRNNSLFVFSFKEKTPNNFKDMFFCWTVWISWDTYNWRMVEGLEVGGRERGIIDDISFNIWAEEVPSILFKHFQTCLLLELSCWKPKKAHPAKQWLKE